MSVTCFLLVFLPLDLMRHYVPFEAEFAVAVFVGSYLAIWAAVFSSLAGPCLSSLEDNS